MARQDNTKIKKKRIVSAKSLANLRPQKAGEPSHNPEGGRVHNPLIKALKNITNDIFREVLETVLISDEQALEELQHPKQPSLKRLVAKAMENAIRVGDYGLVERIAERLVGPITKSIDINSKSINTNSTFTEIQIVNTVKKLEGDV